MEFKVRNVSKAQMSEMAWFATGRKVSTQAKGADVRDGLVCYRA
jgi:hypothetical protein